MIWILQALLSFFGPPGQVGQCNPEQGEPYTWSQEVREETRQRVQDTCRAVGASDAVCAFADSVVVRESSGRPGVRHTKGPGEHGLGPMGLSLRWHADKWPGQDEDPMFCLPEVSFLVALAVWRSAVTRYGAKTLLDVQAVYAGNWTCYEDAHGHRRCRATPTAGTRSAICHRLQIRGHSCTAKISLADFGRRVPFRERRAFALDLISRREEGDLDP